MKKIKPGYKILALLAVIYFIYFIYSKNASAKLVYKNKIDSILTDIRREDYFSFQDKLTKDLANSNGIENIKEFMRDINITKSTKFKLDNIDDSNKTLIKVSGILVTKNRELPLVVEFSDNNKTLYIKKATIGVKELKVINYSFPISASSSL